jgi:hypothetical protein
MASDHTKKLPVIPAGIRLRDMLTALWRLSKRAVN